MFNLKEEYEKAKERAIQKLWISRPSEKRQREIEEIVDDVCGDFSTADHGTSKADL